MNSFFLKERQSENNYSRTIDLSFTDTAIDKVASVLHGYIPLSSFEMPKPVVQPQQQLALPFVQTSVGNDQIDQSEILSDEIAETTAQNTLDNKSPSNYFDKDAEGFLISIAPDYKGKNKKLQQQRFSLLYVWAYNFFYGEAVPTKEHLIQAAKMNGVHDKNYTTHLNDVISRFLIKSDGTFKLNPNGHREINKILEEMLDADVQGVEYSKPPRKNASRGSRTTKDEVQKVEQWVQMPSKFDGFDVRTLKITADLAILALYDITKELKVENAVKPSLAYEYLTKKYKTVSVTKKNFSDTLSSKSYEKYFGRTSQGLYYLTQEAEKFAESWIS